MNSGLEAGVLFREEQRFRQLWIWALLIGIFLVVSVACVTSLIQPAAAGSGRSPAPLRTYAAPAAALAISAGFLALFCWMRLITEVRPDGLYVKFFPFHLSSKQIPLENVTSCRSVTYSPIGSYGGWGIRYTWKGKAYNVSGNRGVRLDYGNGRHLLIGSQRPDELAAAINTLLARNEGS